MIFISETEHTIMSAPVPANTYVGQKARSNHMKMCGHFAEWTYGQRRERSEISSTAGRCSRKKHRLPAATNAELSA